MPDNDMDRRHTLWQRIGAWWRHLGTQKYLSQKGSGGLGTDDATVGGEGSVVVGRNVYGDIYQVYQSARGCGVLTREAFDRILEAYLHWVKGAYGQTRLWGVEVLNRGHVSAVRDLATVFVPLTLRRFQLLSREEVEELARHTQNDHLQAYLRLAEGRRKAGERMALSSLLSLQERLAIIGGAGSGKSTIIAHLAIQLATAALTGATAVGGLAPSKTALIPLVIPLRYFLSYRRSPPEPMSTPRHGTLAGFIPWYFAKYASPVGLSADFFDRLLLGGGCLLMLDGLDEIVSGPERGWVKQQIEDLANHIYPGNRVMVTAREAGYRDNAVFGDDFLRVDVQDLDEDQIQVLVANWCAQLYPSEEAQRTQELLSAIHDINNLRTHRELPPLINTPLMTTMVVSVKWGETELPRERAKLYEAAVKVILRAQYLHDDPERTELENWGGSCEEQRDCLAILALAMHGQGWWGAVVTQARICEVLGQKLLPDNLESFLQAVCLRGGLLEERADLFQFAHLTFQEFLAAHWLAKQRDAAFPVLQPHLTDSWWREVFLLTYAVARVDFEPFAQQYLTWLSSQTVDGKARLAGLELAGSALLELEKPDPTKRRQRAKGLIEALGDPHLVASGGLRARAGNALARLGDLRFQGDAWYLPAEPLLGFVEIGAGPFLMGSDKAHDPEAYDNELPQHEVTLQRYFIGRFPVTVAQFRAFVEDSGHRSVDDASLEGLPNHPVVRVTWYEALKYCDWLTGQLREWPGMPEPLARLVRQEGWRITVPSEAEWEKAARGSGGRIYPWGNEPDPNRANYSDTGIRTTSAVGCFPGGISPYGVHELSGNVSEWTRSLRGEYPYPADKSGQISRESMDAGREEARMWRGGVQRLPQARAVCLSLLVLPELFVLAHRVSGGGAPLPLSSDLCPSALWGRPEGRSPVVTFRAVERGLTWLRVREIIGAA